MRSPTIHPVLAKNLWRLLLLSCFFNCFILFINITSTLYISSVYNVIFYSVLQLFVDSFCFFECNHFCNQYIIVPSIPCYHIGIFWIHLFVRFPTVEYSNIYISLLYNCKITFSRNLPISFLYSQPLISQEFYLLPLNLSLMLHLLSLLEQYKSGFLY